MDKPQAIVWIPVISAAVFFAYIEWNFFAISSIIVGFLLTIAEYPPHYDLKKAYWHDKDWVMWAIKKDVHNFKYADPTLKRDEEIIFYALKKSPFVYTYLEEDFKQEYFIKKILKKKILILDLLRIDNSPLLNDKKFILYAIEHGHAYGAYACASEELKKDSLIIANALEADPRVLLLLDPEKRNDKKNALKLVSSKGLRLEKMHPELQNDRDVVLAAINNDPDAYCFASEELQYDKEIIHTVIFSDGYRSGYFLLPKDLRADKNLAIAAVKRDAINLFYASPKLRRDEQLRKLYEEGRGYPYEESSRDSWMDNAHWGIFPLNKELDPKEYK